MHNLLSILLGLLSWVLGVAALKKGIGFSLFSSISCCLSLYFQLREALVQVQEADWSCLLDTWDTVVLCAGMLIAVTITLNLLALLRLHKKGTR